VARAAAAAGAQALMVAALVVWASTRFDDVSKFIQTPNPWAAAGLLVLVPLPFFIAGGKEGRWTDYPALFAHSWDIVVRYAAAWVFVGVVWGVTMLSDALFQLVGITVIEDLLNLDVVPYLLTGVSLGMALAVVNELSDYVSPYLVLRLLRLLLPVVLGVIVIFLAALPFRGLSHLFGVFSAATVLMAMAIGATTLVTTALDASDARAANAPLMRIVTQLTALVLPALGGLAGAAIWFRVAQYGWTPNRLAATTIAALVLGYGIAYAAAVLLRRNWSNRIRSANVVLAAVAMGVSVAWLTPAINPQWIATTDQIARFQAGRVDADTLDLWAIGREWGRPGKAGLKRLAAMTDHPQADRLLARLERLKTATSRYSLTADKPTADRDAQVSAIRALLAVRPKGAATPDGLFDDFRIWELNDVASACKRQTPQGNPGCLLLLADLSGQGQNREAVLAELGKSGKLSLRAYFPDPSGGIYTRRSPRFLNGTEFTNDGAQALDRLFADDFSLAPVRAQALHLSGRTIYFGR